jgi:transketolase
MTKEKEIFLKRQAAEIRLQGLKAIHQIKSGHIGGSFSIAEILSVLYFDEMNVFPKEPLNSERDRLVLSKGHCTPTAYAALALKGFITLEELMTFRRIDSRLSGHMCMKVPGVDVSTGSLGQGLSVALGIALSGKCYHKNYDVYVICGDGEIEEGQIWEAAMSAANNKLDNVCLFVDNNKIQLDDYVEQISPALYSIEDKFSAFGWNVITVNGNEVSEVKDAVDQFKEKRNQKPTAIIAQTIKGKGVSIFENKVKWHGSVPSEDEFATAFAELRNQITVLEAR